MAKKVKTHITLPEDTLLTIDKLAGKRGRSKFIAEAAQEKIDRERFLKALNESAGAWKDENHPELATTEEITTHVSKIREESTRKLKGIYHE